jgi:sugar phosphate permease
MPTYFSQHLGFSAEQSALIFTVSTFIISFTSFIAIFVYEYFGRKMNATILVMFLAAAVLFGFLYVVKTPWVNIVLMVLAVMASNAAACMLWSVYCPSLYDTGMVSTATGFLDFVSYMAAAASSSLFASAATTIGWGSLILVWCALMILGVLVCLPYKKWLGKTKG